MRLNERIAAQYLDPAPGDAPGVVLVDDNTGQETVIAATPDQLRMRIRDAAEAGRAGVDLEIGAGDDRFRVPREDLVMWGAALGYFLYASANVDVR